MFWGFFSLKILQHTPYISLILVYRKIILYLTNNQLNKLSMKSIKLLLCLLCTISIKAQINFIDEATSLGIAETCGDTPIGNGISFYDYNNDGWDDITLPSQAGQPLRFFKNVNGAFIEDNINIPSNTSQHKQVNWVDFDNDGDKDLFVTSNASSNKLYLNDGNLNFTDVTVASQLPTINIFTYGAAWGDYNNDGFLDVFLSNRDVNEIVPNYLYRNNGDGTFTDVSVASGILNVSDLTFCAAFLDFNNDGWQDIYVSNDRIENPNVLYKNNGDGTFTDVSVSSNTNLMIGAMSVTVEDYNNDGWLDIYVTNTAEGNVFLKNNGDETFTNVAVTNGTTFNSIAWGAVFLDADNDMDLDIYVSGLLDGSNSNYLSAAFYENDGLGQFSIPNAGFSNDTRESYSNAIGDVDNDGLPEIIVSNADNENIFIWKNETITTNNWLKVKLEGVQSNRDGIGSLIEISINGNKQYRYTLCGEGYLGQNSRTESFGIGANTIIDYVKVSWLSGNEDIYYNIAANQTLNIQEGNSTLSIDEYNFGTKAFLFPNPALNTLTIKAEHNIDRLVIYNVLGEEVLRETFAKVKTKNISVAQLNTGLYFIKLAQDNVERYTLQFIKK